MRGLILNNFYSMEDTLKLSFIIAIFSALLSLGINSPNILSAIISCQFFMILGNISASLHVDESSKWNKMEITLPVTRGDIITAKYISFIGLILLGALFGLITIAITLIKGVPLSISAIIGGYTFGLSYTIITISILYPLILKFGAKKSETMLFISFGVAIGICFLIRGILSLFIKDLFIKGVNFNSTQAGVVTTIVSISFFILSYFISVNIHRKKNF